MRKNWDEVIFTEQASVLAPTPPPSPLSKSQIEKLCTVKSVFTSNKLQPRITPKLLVSLLMAAHAPADVMAKYLKLIADSEEKFRLANARNCYSAAIDVRGGGRRIEGGCSTPFFVRR